jgi:hypothetical protein
MIVNLLLLCSYNLLFLIRRKCLMLSVQMQMVEPGKVFQIQNSFKTKRGRDRQQYFSRKSSLSRVGRLYLKGNPSAPPPICNAARLVLPAEHSPIDTPPKCRGWGNHGQESH